METINIMYNGIIKPADYVPDSGYTVKDDEQVTQDSVKSSQR